MKDRLGLLIAAAIVGGTLTPWQLADAHFHINTISEIMAGHNGDPSIQFIELKVGSRDPDEQKCQATGNLVEPDGGGPLVCDDTGPGAHLLFFDAAGNQTAEFIFTNNTPSGFIRQSILIATQAFADLPTTPQPDHIMPPHLVANNGKVCYKNIIGAPFPAHQCLSYGAFTGNTEGFQQPAAALPIDGRTSLKELDEIEDEFNNNATSYALSTPEPSNNAGETGTLPPPTPTPTVTLVSAILPTSRSVQVGNSATAFATIINVGAEQGIDCSIAPATSVAADFFYQTTDPATNVPSGTRDTPVNINSGSSGNLQTFLVSFTPTAAFGPTDVAFDFDCTNTNPATSNEGLNTLLLSASVTPVPDVVALALTPSADGIAKISGASGVGVFSVASINVGSNASISVEAELSDTSLPVTVTLCETNPANSVCTNPTTPGAGPVTTDINAGGTPTFGVFLAASGNVALDAALNRVFVRFKEGSGAVRGSTSVAITTQ